MPCNTISTHDKPSIPTKMHPEVGQNKSAQRECTRLQTLSDKFTAIQIKRKENQLLAESNDCSTEVPMQVFSRQLRPVSSSKPDEAKPDTV
jgi:hypothetical protein